MGMGHLQAHDAPTKRPPQFKGAGQLAVDRRPASGFIGGIKRIALAKTADWFPPFAKPPGVDADPAEILVAIPQMGEFPVQNRGQPGRANQEITTAEITVHDMLRRGARHPLCQPGEGEVEHRAVDAVGSVQVKHCGPRFRRGRSRQSNVRHRRQGHGMQLGQRGGAIAGQRPACSRIGRCPQPFRGQCLAVNPLGEQRITQPITGLRDGDNRRHRDAVRRRQPNQLGLCRPGQGCAFIGRTLQDHRPGKPVLRCSHRVGHRGSTPGQRSQRLN